MLQGVSTDPEKLGPRAAEVEGRTMLQLLRDCSGAFRPGILTALVGSSGAGKTTLMDVLAGRKTSAPPPHLHRTPGQRHDAATGGGCSACRTRIAIALPRTYVQALCRRDADYGLVNPSLVQHQP